MKPGKSAPVKDKRWISEQLCVCMASRCNLACVYCHSPGRGRAADRQDIKERIARGHVVSVSLEGGGEPTRDPGLLDWIDFLKSCGVKSIMLSTNAVALADRALCRRLDKHIDHYSVNIPACDEETYRRATRTARFPEAVQGLENLMSLGAGPKVRFFHNVFKGNYKGLPKFAAWVVERFPQIAFTNFTFIRNLGRVGNRVSVLPRYGEVVPFVKIALAYLKTHGKKAVVQNIPLCLLREFEGFAFEFQRWRRGDRVLEAGVRDKLDIGVCRKCMLRDACAGARPDYVSVYGAQELAASERRPESINPERF